MRRPSFTTGEPVAASSARARRCSVSAAWSKSVVSTTTSPSISTRARLARRATSRSCVTRMTVRPSASLSSRKKAMISRLVRVSRLPVGSSHSRIGGSLTSARAMATRCCWPPESWFGRWSTRLPRPTRAEQLERPPLPPPRGQLRLYRSGVLDIFQGGRPRQQVEVLEDEADAPVADLGQLVRVQPRHLLAGQAVTAVGGAVEAAQGVHERRFAGAGRADQGDEFAFVDVQRHPLEGREPSPRPGRTSCSGSAVRSAASTHQTFYWLSGLYSLCGL